MHKQSTALAICALVASTIAVSHAAEPATNFSVAVVKGSIGLPVESGETSISSLAVGDFNFDGNTDIAVGDEISTVGGLVGAGSATIAFGDPLVPIRPVGQRIYQDSSGVNCVAE